MADTVDPEGAAAGASRAEGPAVGPPGREVGAADDAGQSSEDDALDPDTEAAVAAEVLAALEGAAGPPPAATGLADDDADVALDGEDGSDETRLLEAADASLEGEALDAAPTRASPAAGDDDDGRSLAQRRAAETVREPAVTERDETARVPSAQTGHAGQEAGQEGEPEEVARAPGPASPGPGAPKTARAPSTARRLVPLAAFLLPPLLLTLGSATVGFGALRTAWHGRDHLEPNDRLAARALVGEGKVEGLSSIDGDLDWFGVVVPAERSLVLEVTPESSGPGGIRVCDLTGARLADSSAVAGTQRAAVAAQPVAQELAFCVWGARRRYALSVRFVDPSERFEPNDGPEQAALLPLGRTSRVLCSGVDWFRADVPAGRALTVRLVEGGEGLRLSRGTDAELPGRALTFPVVGAARRVSLRVDGRGLYSLDLALGDADPAAPSGPRALPVVRGAQPTGRTRADAQPIAPGRYPDLRCDDDAWFLLEVPPDGLARAAITFDPGHADLELELLSEDGTPLEASHGSGAVEAAHAQLERGGAVLVHVYGGQAPFGLVVSSAGRRELPAWAGTLGPGRFEDVAASGDDLWRVRLAAGERLRARLGADRGPRDGRSHRLELFDADLERIAGGAWNVEVDHVAPGTRDVYLRALSSTPTYDLDVTVEPYDPSAADEGDPSTPPGPAPRLRTGTQFVTVGPGELRRRIDLRAGQEVEVTLSFRNAAGDVDAWLLDAAEGELAASTGTSDREQLRHRALVDGPVFLRVTPGGGQQRVRVVLALSGGHEALAPGRHEGLECAGTREVEVAVPAGRRVVAEIAFDAAACDLDLELRDAAGRVVAASEGTGPTERVVWLAPTEQTVRLRVHNGTGSFTLDLRLEDP